jgi:hypothetical protein
MEAGGLWRARERECSAIPSRRSACRKRWSHLLTKAAGHAQHNGQVLMGPQGMAFCEPAQRGPFGNQIGFQEHGSLSSQS